MRSHAKASSVGSNRRFRAFLGGATLILALVAILALASTAFAKPARFFQSSFGAFSTESPQALAVDEQTGDVYALDASAGQLSRFTAAGAPDEFPATGDNTIDGLPLEAFGDDHLAQVAVDRSGGPADGDIYVANGSGVVQVFDEDGEALTTLTGEGTPGNAFGLACGVAVDQETGDVYVGDFFAPGVWRYTPKAPTPPDDYAADYSGGISTSIAPCAVATAKGKVYAGDTYDRAGVDRFDASDFATGTPPSPTPVTIVPGGATALAADPVSGDLFVDKGAEVQVFDSTSAASRYAFATGLNGGSAGVAVKGGGSAYVSNTETNKVDVYGPEVNIQLLKVVKAGLGKGTVSSSPAGIDCGATCQALFSTSVTLTATADAGSQFKAWSGCDSATGNECTVSMSADTEVTATFSTRPSISGELAIPGLEDAHLNAQVNPGNEPTTFHFDYGLTAAYGNSTPESASVGEDAVNHAVSQAIGGLQPNTTYHFRIVATNALGTTPGVDHTFKTYSPPYTFEPCPNDAFRTGPGARLPDCRAYEQATPTDKNGKDASGTLFSVQASTSGDAITHYELAGLPGATGFQTTPAFLSRRVGGSWTTEGLMPPASYGDNALVDAWTPDLSLVFSHAGFSGPKGVASAKLGRRSSDGSLFTIIPAGVNASASFAAVSADESKIFLDVNGPESDLTAAGVSGKPNFYVFDRDTGTFTLVGVLPAGEGGGAPPRGSFAGPYSWAFGPPSNALIRGGSTLGYLTQELHAISSDGEKAFFTAGSTGQLYLRKDPPGPSPSTVHVSASKRTDCADHDPCSGTPEPDPVGAAPAAFQYATPSGSKAFFTSTEELTDDANTGPARPPLKLGIGRVNLDGVSGLEPDLLDGHNASGIAVDSKYVYWADPANGTIGRAELDGQNPDDEFIVPGPTTVEEEVDTGQGEFELVTKQVPSKPNYVAVDSGHVYWTNIGDGKNEHGSIGRVDIEGTPASIEPECIKGATNPQGIAVNATHIYWANAGDPFTPGGGPRAIGRAEISCDGAVQEFQRVYALGSANPEGVALSSSRVYWTSEGDSGHGISSIERAPLGGVETPEIKFLGEGGELRGIAVAGDDIYWAARGEKAIGHAVWPDAEPEPTTAEKKFIEPDGELKGVAVDSGHIYWSTDGEVFPNPGNDLYEFDTTSNELTDLVPDSADENGAEVQGVLGASDDGEYLYFAANADLDSTGQATPGDCQQSSTSLEDFDGSCNLYLWHGGSIKFISSLQMSAGEASNWAPTGANSGFKSSRVSPGGTLLFSASAQLTPYDNDGFRELYRYQPETEKTTCTTCKPSGEAPTRGGLDLKNGDLDHQGSAHFTYNGQPFLSRNLSADGKQVFFQTAEKLLGADVNGNEGCPSNKTEIGAGPACLDVYEWEAPGKGSCTEASAAYSAQDEGCIYLLSTGTSAFPSYLADVSASGDAAFIFTRDRLVPADKDDLQDIYAVTTEGGLASQHQVSLPPCEGDACRGAGSGAPSRTGAGTAAFSGPGNQPGATGKSCPKGRRAVRRKGKVRCVAPHRKKRHARHHKRANHDRRTSR